MWSTVEEKNTKTQGGRGCVEVGVRFSSPQRGCPAAELASVSLQPGDGAIFFPPAAHQGLIESLTRHCRRLSRFWQALAGPLDLTRRAPLLAGGVTAGGSFQVRHGSTGPSSPGPAALQPNYLAWDVPEQALGSRSTIS